MNKIVKLALILLVVIVVVIAGASFYLVKNGQAILNQNKPFLEAKVSEILKTPVALGTLKLQVFPNAVVDVESLTIGKTAKSAGIAVQGIKLDVAIMELLKKKLLIKELSVNSPSLKILKTTAGILIDGLPTPEKKLPSQTEEVVNQPTVETSSEATEVPAGIEIALQKFQINNASIEFEDQIANKKFLIKPLSVGASVQLVGSIAKLLGLTFQTEIAGITNVALSSEEISFDLKEQTLNLPAVTAKILDADFKVNSNLNLKSFQGNAGLAGANLDLANVASALTAFTPALKAMGLAGNVAPDIKIEIKDKKDVSAIGTIKLSKIAAKLGTIAVSQLAGNLNLNANLNKQIVTADDLSLLVGSAPVNLSLKANLTGATANLDDLLVKIFGGTANISAVTDLKAQTFNTNVKVGSLDLGEAHKALPMPILATFTGTLNSLNLKANGSLGSKLLSSLNAQGDLLLTNGNLKGTNLPAKVLGVIKDLPFIAGSLLDAVPENLRGEINGPDTAIRELKTNFTLANSNLKINSLSLLSTIFNLTADGTIGLDKTLNLNAEITFNQAFSQALRTKTKELKRVLDQNGQLVLPIQIKGTAQSMIIIPNLKRLIELGATNAIKEKVTEKIQGKLGEKSKELFNKFGF